MESNLAQRPARSVPRPQLAQLSDFVPEGPEWIHENKYDGYRILAEIPKNARGKIHLWSRNGKDWTERFYSIAAFFEKNRNRIGGAILDGEIVVLDERGNSHFSRLQESISTGKMKGYVYFVFDLLRWDGSAICDRDLLSRKRLLKEFFAKLPKNSLIREAPYQHNRGAQLHRQACRSGGEGIISKRADLSYSPGRSPEWRKTKCLQIEDFIILGFTEGESSRKELGALLLGYLGEKDQHLHFAGKVGSGFSSQSIRNLRKKLKKINLPAASKSEWKELRGNRVHWVRPNLVAQIQFSEWTTDARLRHPVFLGLREDKAASEVRLSKKG